MWIVLEGGDIGFNQAGACGFGEKWSDSGSILKVELSGFSYRLDGGVDLRKKAFVCFIRFVSPTLPPASAGWGLLGRSRWGGGHVEWHSWVWGEGGSLETPFWSSLA